jgi:ppGpp synthetase/RelA/SpoT-type nucleotidyltranferase
MDPAEMRARLIEDQFPFGQPGFPATPATSQARDQAVRAWLEARTLPFRASALTLIARVAVVLHELRGKLPEHERHRLFARIDNSALVKAPESILEKMCRSWNADRGCFEVSFHNFETALKDLGRFRIVANFLSDVHQIARALEAPFKSPGAALTAAQQELHRDYCLESNSLEDLICVEPEKRAKGERCRKGIFHPRPPSANQHLHVEVQIQTLLQEAWDKKDHFLIYEPRRRGANVKSEDTIEIFAISELLYVADLTFDRIKDRISGGRP